MWHHPHTLSCSPVAVPVSELPHGKSEVDLGARRPRFSLQFCHIEHRVSELDGGVSRTPQEPVTL